MVDTTDAFWRLAKVAGPDDCWEWLGEKDWRGVGTLAIAGRHNNACRVAYVKAIGPLNGAGHVFQRCKNYACVNPGHLFVGRHPGKPNLPT